MPERITAAEWRARAAEARQQVARTGDPEFQETLTYIAEKYERLAKYAEDIDAAMKRLKSRASA